MKFLTSISQVTLFSIVLKIAFAFALILGCFFSIVGCSQADSTFKNNYQSPYDWTGLHANDGRLTYSESGEIASELGVDVSSHQGAIDWNAVANDGIDFAIVRLGNRGYTAGDLYVDQRFADNVAGADASGLDVGVYFFSQAINEQEALEEANFVLEQLSGRALDLPVVFDHEPVADAAGRANNVTGDALADITRTFCERLEAAGYQTMIYGNKHDIARFSSANDYGNRPVWFAEYGVNIPTGAFDFVMWQYSNNGAVAGISTRVDMNILFTS